MSGLVLCRGVNALATLLSFVGTALIDDFDFGTTRDPEAIGESSMFLGKMVENDEIILELEVEKKIKRNRVAGQTVEFPSRNKINKKIINFIAAVDCNAKAEGQPPELLSGGINQTHATILLRSSKGKSLNYIVHIRGIEPGVSPGKPRTPPTWTGPKNYTRKQKMKATTPLSTT